MRPSWVHLLIVIAVVLLLFGAPKLPGLARSLGQSLRIFKSEVKEMKKDDETGEAGTTGTPIEGTVVGKDKGSTAKKTDASISDVEDAIRDADPDLNPGTNGGTKA